MRIQPKVLSFIIFAFGVLVAPANAATINFDSILNAGQGQVYDENGLNIDVLDGYMSITAVSPVSLGSIVSPTLFFDFYPRVFVSGNHGLGICAAVGASTTSCATNEEVYAQHPGLENDPDNPFEERGDDSAINASIGRVPEALIFDFQDDTFDITQISFQDSDGNDISQSDTEISILAKQSDGTVILPGGQGLLSMLELAAFLQSGGFSDIVQLFITTAGSDNTNTDFFVSSMSFADDVSEVPLPAALWLFAAGLGGLGFARKNKRSV